MKRKKTRPPQAASETLREVQEALRRQPPGPGGYEAAEAARTAYESVEPLWRQFPQDDAIRRAGLEARERYRESLRSAFPPGFSHSMDCLRAGDPSGLEDAVTFLEADPIFYGTGYLKEDLSRLLRDVELPPDYVSRLQAVVLSIVDRRDGREFRAFCRIARKVDAPKLREQLGYRLTRALPSGEDLTADQPSLLQAITRDKGIRRRAKWMLEALGQNQPKGKRP